MARLPNVFKSVKSTAAFGDFTTSTSKARNQLHTSSIIITLFNIYRLATARKRRNESLHEQRPSHPKIYYWLSAGLLIGTVFKIFLTETTEVKQICH